MNHVRLCLFFILALSPSALADGRICGGLQGAQCGKGEFCDYPEKAMCGAADDVGTCKAIPDTKVMRLMLDPVCGCDDKTYPNKTTANSKGISVSYKGECKPQHQK